jgi:NCAIR mutase (PurE)-related protein
MRRQRSPPELEGEESIVREDELRAMLAAVASGALSLEDAVERLAQLPFLDLGEAKVDVHREIRSGVAETVFAPGKTIPDLVRIVDALLEAHGRVLVTRTRADQARALLDRHPDARHDERSGILTVGEVAPALGYGIAVLAAGTADLPVAEEAAICAEWLGATVDRHYDVGVAGVHRLLHQLDVVRRAEALIVVAGMDGALPTLVAGLVRSPVIAVPTSIGYGASFGGLAALLTMLNACAPGLAVVNIDNGYGAAVMAHRICAPRPLHLRTSKTGTPARSPRGTRRGPAPSRRRRRPA